MKSYFYKAEYKYLYLGRLFYSLANTLIETFGTVMLYKNGIPIWAILLIYGLRFGIMGLTTPLFIKISSKFGIAKCILISNIFSILSTYMILNSTNLYKNIIIFILVMGLNGISNPANDALSSKYVETQHRGRYNSILNISRILGAAIASGIVALGIITNNNILLFFVIMMFFLAEYFCIKKIDYKPQNIKNIFKETMKYIFTTKNNYKNIYSLRTNHIIERLFLPLYLYIILQDFALFSSITIISLLLQVITITLIGRYCDKNLMKSNNLVTFIKTFITGIFLFTRNKIIISINKTLNDNFQKVYETSIQTSIQNIIKNQQENNELLSTIGQMTLCFTELIVFIILAIISRFIGNNVFIIIFILSILSNILINKNIKETNLFQSVKEK